MPVDKAKMNEAITDVTKLLLDKTLTGEEYLLVLQTLVSHVLAANNIGVKKIWLMNLNADVRARRVSKLQQMQSNATGTQQ